MSRTSSRSHTVADRLHSASIHLLRAVRREDEATGISPARLSALSVLVFAGPQSLSALADAEQVSAPTMTRIVDGLEADGLARRRPNPDDRRGVSVQATAKGRRVLERARVRRLERLAAALSSLSAEELDTLARAAALIERSLGSAR